MNKIKYYKETNYSKRKPKLGTGAFFLVYSQGMTITQRYGYEYDMEEYLREGYTVIWLRNLFYDK